MTRRGVGKFGRLALWFSPVVIAAAGFFAVLRWLRPTPVVAAVMSVVLGILMFGYAGFLAKRESRRWDEVQRASWGFACAHGWVWGGGATLLLLMVPPVMSRLVDQVNAVVNATGASPDVAHRVALQLAFYCGSTLVMVMQTLALIVASFVWQRRMGGSGERS
jgi:hypothetical protein